MVQVPNPPPPGARRPPPPPAPPPRKPSIDRQTPPQRAHRGAPSGPAQTGPGDERPLTPPQRAALAHLAEAGLLTECYPASIGHAMERARAGRGERLARGGRGMTAQGAGRVGGSMGTRLVKMGLAHSTGRGYCISSQGLRIHKEQQP